MDEPDDEKVVPLRAGDTPNARGADRMLAECKADVLGLLEELLVLARAGQLDSLFATVSRTDGKYSEAISKTLKFHEMIGQVEVVKQHWIGKYLGSLQGRPLG